MSNRDLELYLSIGGLVGHVVIVAAPGSFAAEIEQRFSPFLLPGAHNVACAFSLRLACAPGRPRALPDGTQRNLTVLAQADALQVQHWDFEARLARSLTSSLTSPGRLDGVGSTRPTHFAFESLLRVLWSALLPQSGGALFHACGLHDAGRGLLAAGPSGAGKTTLARKAAEDDVLSDEVVAVHRGSNGAWRISATPFFGELQRGGGSMRSFPLAGIALLEQRPALSVQRLSRAAAIQRVLGCLLCFETDAATAERNFNLVLTLCREVPTFVCASRAEDSLADIVAAMAPLLAVPPTPNAPPQNTRELVSALRSSLRRHGHFAFRPRGGSMRPFVRTGDSIFVEAVDPDQVQPGDVVLFWRVGRTPERDTLICHRLVGQLPGQRGPVFVAKGDSLTHLESFENGQRAQLIGRVSAISRGDQTWPVPGRLRSVGILLASLALLPLLPLRRLVPWR